MNKKCHTFSSTQQQLFSCKRHPFPYPTSETYPSPSIPVQKTQSLFPTCDNNPPHHPPLQDQPPCSATVDNEARPSNATDQRYFGFASGDVNKPPSRNGEKTSPPNHRTNSTPSLCPLIDDNLQPFLRPSPTPLHLLPSVGSLHLFS